MKEKLVLSFIFFTILAHFIRKKTKGSTPATHSPFQPIVSEADVITISPHFGLVPSDYRGPLPFELEARFQATPDFDKLSCSRRFLYLGITQSDYRMGRNYRWSGDAP
jgi:hypothetical protein